MLIRNKLRYEDQVAQLSDDILSYIEHTKMQTEERDRRLYPEDSPNWAKDVARELNNFIDYYCGLGTLNATSLNSERAKEILEKRNSGYNTLITETDLALIELAYSELKLDDQSIKNGCVLFKSPYLEDLAMDNINLITFDNETSKYTLYESKIDEEDKRTHPELLKLLKLKMSYNAFKFNDYYYSTDKNDIIYNLEEIEEDFQRITNLELYTLKLVKILSSKDLIDIEETIVSKLLKCVGWENTTPS